MQENNGLGRNMRKVSFILLLALILSCFGLYSCAMRPDPDDGKLVVVCSVFAQYDICREIIGDAGEAVLLVRNGVDMHSYEPTSKDILTVARADMLVYTGGASDAWVDGVLRSADNKSIRTAELFDYAELLCTEHNHEHEHEHEHEHDGEEYDEHVWTSPKNVMRIAQGLCNAICEVYPEGEDVFRANTERYLDELSKLDAEFEELFSGNDITLIVGDRFPFLYLAHDYGVAYHAAFSGCSSETGASFEVIMSLIDEAKECNARVIFDTDNSGSDVARRVAEECGCEVRTLYSCQSITNDALEHGETYISLMRKNLDTLREAYNK